MTGAIDAYFIGYYIARFEALLVGHDPQSLSVQLGCLLLCTLVMVYAVATTRRKWIYIRSHGWVFLDALAASVVCLGFYHICIDLSLKWWIALVLVMLWWRVVELSVTLIDRGKSIVDLDAKGASFLRSDFLLIRRASILALVLLINYRSL
jgi:hypothetical protein